MAAALAAGLFPGRAWITEAALLVAVGQGMLAGLVLPRFWRGPAKREIFGAGGRYLGFVAAVIFCAVEAYAVGRGLGTGAPGLAALLLGPPVLVAAAVLRSARRARREEGSEPA